MTIASLFPEYAWLDKEPGPRLMLEMIKVAGTKEVSGPGDNPTIVEWAEAEGFHNFHDAIPWCGITMGYVMLQAGWGPLPVNPAGAANYLKWGDPVQKGNECFSDVLVFHRVGGNHVALYVGESAKHVHILGGNQKGDAVNIELKLKSDLIGVRRCPWRINQPSNITKRYLQATGVLAGNDA